MVTRLILGQVIQVRILDPQPFLYEKISVAPSSSQAQDTGFSFQRQGFESPWGYHNSGRS